MSGELTVLPQGPKTELGIPKEVSQDFDKARGHYREAAHASRTMAGHLVLCGVELVRLHKIYGIKAGRPASGKIPQELRNYSWGELVEAEMGFSESKARYCMEMARAIGRKVDVVEAALLKPVMRSEDREAMETAIRKITDGQTMTQLMLDFGITKSERRGAHGGHSGGSGGDDGSAEPLTLEAEAQRDVWQVLERLGLLANDARFEALIRVLPLNSNPDKGQLASLHVLERELERWSVAVKAAIKEAKKHR